MPGKPARHGNVLVHVGNGPWLGRVHVNPGVRRPEAIHDRRARRVADRCLTMGIGEKCSPLGKTINIGRIGVGMTSQAAYPVVHVVNRD